MVFSLALASVVAMTPVQARPMNVMSFNIRYDNDSDGENKWLFRRSAAVETIRREKPDVVGLQEALRHQLDNFKQLLPDFVEVGVGRDDGKEAGEYAAILFNKKRFELQGSGTFWFSEAPDQPGSKAWGANVTRICTWAKLRDLQNKRLVTLYNVHLDHESQTARERSVAMLISKIALADDVTPVVITGDFNAGEDNPAIRNMLGKFKREDDETEDTRWWPYFLDTFREKNPPAAVEGTFHNFTGKPGQARIDYVFVSPEWSVLEAKVVREPVEGRYPSDHFPVTARIQLE